MVDSSDDGLTKRTMTDMEISGDDFDSTLVGTSLVIRLKSQAMQILTDLQSSSKFHNVLAKVTEANTLNGYVQIKDSDWDSHTDVDNLSQLIADDDEFYTVRGRSYGFRHDVLMARFRNTIGQTLLTLNSLGKPMVAGLQGRVSAEYLGLTLLFDLRLATSDTTISFDNVRTGIPSSPCITLLMPGYIGTGKTLALANQGSIVTAQEALELGLISEIVENEDELTQACIDRVGMLAENHLDIIDFNRQAILPSDTTIDAALEKYYKFISEALIRRRQEKA
jgi:enoyl-CoA hydratase/carnithine racemase